MPLVHFKRYRMTYPLSRPIWEYQLPEGYQWLAWDHGLQDLHALVKHRSFQNEVDANVFPCFASRASCRKLMRDICGRDGFLPAATWLILAPGRANDSLSERACGTVQGIGTEFGLGSIQNLGVVLEHRGLGLGRALLGKSLEGFQLCGMSEAMLEVTCDNFGAVRLYENLGWKIDQIVYKASELTSSAAFG